MKNFPFSFDRLKNFSESDPYQFVPALHQGLYEELERRSRGLNFPSIKKDVGSLISFFISYSAPKRIFEMGSGYGHSAYWYFVGSPESVVEVVLTEKREDLKEVFDGLPWPINWKNRMNYIQGDAFEALEKADGEFDFFLIDGVKGDYLKFLKSCVPKLSKGGLIAIDNSFWRGSFLKKELREKKASARGVAELHEYIREQKELASIFVPFSDGLTLLKKN